MPFTSILVVTIILLLMSDVWYWYMARKDPNLNKLMFKNINFKTGDIILFHAWDNSNTVFLGTYWGHVGIVYKDPKTNIPMLFEAAKTKKMLGCPEYNKHGIMITDLKTRLEKYPGLIACKILNNNLDECAIQDLHKFIEYSKSNMSYNNNIVYNYFKKLFGDKLNNLTNCGELVTLSLIKLNWVKQN